MDESKFNYDYILREGSCGTSGCALGWAAHIPEFKEAGLYLSNDDNVAQTSDNYISYRLGYRTDKRDIKDSMTAAALFFNITIEEAEFIFIPESFYNENYSPSINASAKEVGEFILEFVNSHE